MDDPLYPLLLALRYMHILGAITLMGGTIFMRFALAPVVAGLDDQTKRDIHQQVRSRWAKLVMLAAALREGFRGPVFIQGHHFQVNAKKYAADRDPEVNAVKALAREGTLPALRIVIDEQDPQRRCNAAAGTVDAHDRPGIHALVHLAP